LSALTIERLPEFSDPVLIVSFSGWNDAGSAATHACQFLVKQMQADRFASIDPEEFYNFSDLRPRVRLTGGIYREIVWPANEFFGTKQTAAGRHLVVGIGIEPHLRWKAYAQAFLEIARRCGAKLVVTLGALLADVPYSKPVRVVGFSSDEKIAAQLELTPSRYEGPTGIVGVLNDACRQAGLTSVSFWANVPHYISAAPNPKAALALLDKLQSFLGWTVGTEELGLAAREFDLQIGKAIAENPNLATYVKQLENEDGEESADSQVFSESGAGNGRAGEKNMEEEVQRFLRQRKERKDDA